MADTLLYSTKDTNDKLKADAKEAGATLAFDRVERSFKLVTEGVKPADVKKLKTALKAYTTPEAKAAWQTDRDANIAAAAEKQSAVETGREEARSRASTTTEKAPAKKSDIDFSNALIVYPAASQKIEYRAALKESGSTSKYFDAKQVGEGNEHYKLVTSVPDKFAQFTGEEAKARFQREYAEKGTAPEKNMDTEIARDAAKGRAGAAFMAQYKDKGFLLAAEGRAPKHAQDQLDTMRGGTSDQLLEVLRVSRDRVQPLRDKETQMRAEAAHVPIEDFRKRSFSEQREVRDTEGNQIQLTGDDRRLHDQLTRGIKALDAELRARGVGQSVDRSQGKSQEQGQEKGEQQQRRQSPAKTPKAAAAEVSDDTALEALARSAARRSAGR
jgi:hypothetical protein